MIEKHDMAFWLSAAGATVIKILTSQYGGPIRMAASVLAALFSAYFFTSPALHFLGLDPEVYTTLMAAVMALTGEGIMRFIISLSNNPEKVIDLFQLWRKG
jgi:hypothetical protein